MPDVKRRYTSPPVADLPFDLDPQISERLVAALDVEGKLTRTLEALGPIGDRDVVVVGCGDEERRRLAGAGARLTLVDPLVPGSASGWPLAEGSADVVLAAWSAFRGVEPAELAEADRVLREAGRLLVVHDYGRDDVARLRGDIPEYGAWSRREGPFIASGFRIRVLHCWWTFESFDEARSILGAAFGEAGERLAADLKRPRIAHNLAVYHRTRGRG